MNLARPAADLPRASSRALEISMIRATTFAAVLALAAAGWSPAAPARAEPFVFTLLPADQNCLQTVEMDDPQLCLLRLVESAPARDCLVRGGGIATGAKSVCWYPTGRKAVPVKIPGDASKALAKCLGGRQGASLRGGQVACLPIPKEVAGYLFPVGSSVGTKRVGDIPQSGNGPTFPTPR